MNDVPNRPDPSDYETPARSPRQIEMDKRQKNGGRAALVIGGVLLAVVVLLAWVGSQGPVADPAPATDPVTDQPTGQIGTPAPTASSTTEDAVRAALADQGISVETDQDIKDIGAAICGALDGTQARAYAVAQKVAETFFDGDLKLGAYATGVYGQAYCPELLPG